MKVVGERFFCFFFCGDFKFPRFPMMLYRGDFMGIPDD